MDKPTKVYLAGKYERKDELRGYANRLAQAGYTITSNWLYQLPQSRDEPRGIQERWAIDCWRGVRECDLLILFSDSPEPQVITGGCDVEFGMAYAITKECWLVGKPRNIFHALRDVKHFVDFNELWAKEILGQE